MRNKGMTDFLINIFIGWVLGVVIGVIIVCAMALLIIWMIR